MEKDRSPVHHNMSPLVEKHAANIKQDVATFDQKEALERLLSDSGATNAQYQTIVNSGVPGKDGTSRGLRRFEM